MKGNNAMRFHRRIAFGAAALAALVSLGSIQQSLAQGLVYVEGIDQLGGAQENIFTNTGAVLDATTLDPQNTANAAVPNNNIWNFRDEGVPEPIGNFATIYESIQENSPELQVRILSGLTPNASYDLYVVYWSDLANWGVRAGLTSNPGMNPIFNRTGGVGATAGTLASSVIWSTPPTDNPEATDDDPSPFVNITTLGGTAAAATQTMFLARVGTATASAQGSANVFVDDIGSLTEINQRAWFDGLAYAPAGTSVVIGASINRDTGALTIRNTTTGALDIASYNVTSAAGSLDATTWDSIAVGGNTSITEAQPWTVSAPTTPAASVTALTEAETTPANGAQLGVVAANGDFDMDVDVDGNDFLALQRGTVALNAANTTLFKNSYGQSLTVGTGNFNLGNVWVKSPIQDVSITVNLVNGQQLTIAPTYTGTALASGDFNGDSLINLADFQILQTNMDTNVSTLNAVQTYKLGDITQNKVIDLEDFATFRPIYDAANGVGAFEAALVAASGGSLTAVPEPAAGALAALAAAALVGVRRRRSRVDLRSNQDKEEVKTMDSHQPRHRASQLALAFLVVGVVASDLQAQVTTPITNWFVRENTGTQGRTIKTNANTNSPSFGVAGDGMVGTLDGTDGLGIMFDPDDPASGNADDATIWAAIPPVTLANGQEMVFNGSVTFTGVPITGDTFRFGMYDGPNFTGTYDPATVETPMNLGGVPAGWKGFATRPGGGGAGVGYFDARNPANPTFATAPGFTSTFGTPGSTYPLAGVGTGTWDDPAVAGTENPQTQTPTQLVIGLSQGPASVGNFGGAAPNNVYNFRITLGKFGFENTMSALLEKTNGTYRWTRSATASPNQDTNPTFIPTEFDRVGFLLSNGMNTDLAAFSNITFTVQQIQSLILDVNTATGAMRIRNASGTPFDITGYRITSAAGSLNSANWTGLDINEGGDPVGTGWDRSGGAGSNALTEVNLTGTRLMNNGDSFSLGNAFRTSGVTTQDLLFFFSTADGTLTRGVLNYSTTAPVGAVAEPGSLALAGLGTAALFARRRRGKA